MTSKERVLRRERERGRADALQIQAQAASMTGTELYEADDRIPRFAAAVGRQNMLTRSAGFVCKSTAGRVVRLLQPYDSGVFPQEPEELPAQWDFLWSRDHARALPFTAISTSPYMTGDCCSENGKIYTSIVDHNVSAPSVYPDGWEQVNG